MNTLKELRGNPMKIAAVLSCAALFAGCSDSDNSPATTTSSSSEMMSSSEMASSSSEAMAMNIVEVAQANGSFTLLLDAATRAGIASALIDNSNLTVFAPTDAAFEKAGITAEVLAEMSEDDLASLATTLTYHVHAGADPVLAETALTLSGEKIPMFTTDMDETILTVVGEGETAKLFINNAQVVLPDVMASNGVIHVIDTVIMPPMPTTLEDTNIVQAVIATDSFSRLEAEVIEAGLVGTLESPTATYTVFAPNNDAFEKIGTDTIGDADILLYHVLGAEVDSLGAFNSNGKSVGTALDAEATIDINIVNGDLYVNASKVIGTDIMLDNGIVHTIDTVLLPPAADTVAAAVIADDDNFSTLEMLLGMAAPLEGGTTVAEALSDASASYTVFAPTNAAFEAFSQDDPTTYAALLEGGELLRDVLLYHVFGGKRIFSPEAVAAAGGSITMLSGVEVDLELREGMLFINDSQVTSTDVLTKNGVIHVIDAPLVPPSDM